MESITRVGIDASKDKLDVFIDRPQARRHCFSNDLPGIAQLKQALGEGNYLIAIEASGRYEALARHQLEAAGYAVRLQNPRQVRRLAEGLGIQAKTDRIDAEVLARTVELCARNEPRRQEREQLGDLSRTISTLQTQRREHLCRLKVPGLSAVVVKSLRSLIRALDRQIKILDAEFVRFVKTTPLGERYQLAQSIPQVGPGLARVAVSELPENLTSWSIRQISSYGGLAPQDEASGKKVMKSRLSRHKNVHLKAALYMPAMGLIRNQPWAKAGYTRLRARGLTHQQAIVPIMHKLLFHLVAVLKRGSAWEAEPPGKP